MFLQELGNEYAKIYEEETGLSVTFEFINQGSYDAIAEKLTVGAVAGELPVMAFGEEQHLTRFHPLCADLTNYMDPAVIDNYHDGMLVSCYYDGVLKALPIGRSCPQLFVNADLVKQAGYTTDDLKTWEGLHEVALAISKLGDDIEGYGLYWDTDAWMWESALYSNGGEVADEDGNIAFAKEDVGSIYMQLIKDMIKDGSCYVPYAEQDPSSAIVDKFAAGKMGITLFSNGWYPDFVQFGKDGGFELVSMVQPAGKGGVSVTTGGASVYIMDAATETQKDFATKFMAYLATDENQAAWNLAAGYMPVTESVYESEYFAEQNKDPNYLALRDAYNYAHPRPKTPYWREMYTYIYEKLFDFAMNPDKYDAIELNKDMAKYCQGIVDENS